ncbi:MAG: hypothetical protein QGH62_02725 [Nitrospinaceae bacterium]|nr:hypothetical protein [Nitrospinaceae bacterium]
MASRDERKARNIYNESLRRAQAGDTSSYVQGEMQRYGISDPSTAPFRGSGAGNLNPAIDAGKNYIGGLWGGAQRGLDALTQGVAMANENESWFRRNAPNTKRHAGVPMNVRESVMTDRGKAFYDKYVKLAGLIPDEKQYYLDQADTARRNLQITKRINYGMGELGLDETPFKGYESYDQGFEGFGPDDLGPRFDIDRFTEAMSSYLPEEITESITEEDVPLDLSYTPETVWGPEGDPSIGMAGMEEDTSSDYDWTDLWMTDREDDLLGEEEDLTETITEDDGEKFVLKESKFSQGNLGTEGKYDYSPNLDLNIMNIEDSELRKKATDAAIQFNNMWKSGESDMYELEKLYDAYLAAVEAGAQ